MYYRFFTVRVFNPQADTEALNTFLAAHPILSVERAFVADGENSFWSLCVGVADPPAAGERPRKRASVDYRETLSPEVFAVFARLRTLRNRLAEAQGTPPYAIFTNEQLAAMAQLPSPSRQALGAIEGIGDKRLEMYADAFLAELSTPADPAHG